jgi:hypothetical protein
MSAVLQAVGFEIDTTAAHTPDTVQLRYVQRACPLTCIALVCAALQAVDLDMYCTLAQYKPDTFELLAQSQAVNTRLTSRHPTWLLSCRLWALIWTAH